MIKSVIQLKQIVKRLSCLGIPYLNANLIVETNASDLGSRDILKQLLSGMDKGQVVRYYYGTWTPSQLNYRTIKKEILEIVYVLPNFKRICFLNHFY